MAIGYTNTSNYSNIAEAIREQSGSDKQYRPSEMASAIKNLSVGAGIVIGNHTNPKTGKWERPSEWPNLDLLKYGQNEVYLTIDNSGRFDYSFLCMVCQTQNEEQVYYQIGTIENNQFKPTESIVIVNHNEAYIKLFQTSDLKYPIVRIWSNDNITSMGLRSITINNAITFNGRCNAIIERVGDIYTHNSTTEIWAPFYLEREKITYRYAAQDYLSFTWRAAFLLQDLDVSSWDTKNWNITALSATWDECYSLNSLDLNDWDVSNWECSNLTATWYYCYSLRHLYINKWDTSNWSINSLSSTWYDCNSLQELDLSNIDTSNWSVGSLAYTWYGCNSLKELDLSNMDTSNWSVSDLSYTWYLCRSLKTLKLNNWDTSNFTFNNFYRTINGAALDTVDVSAFDVSKLSYWGWSGGINPLPTFAVNFIAGDENSGKFIPTSFKTFDVSNSTLLTRQALLNIIDMLGNGSGYTLNLGSVNKSKLLSSEIAIATNKGWTVA